MRRTFFVTVLHHALGWVLVGSLLTGCIPEQTAEQVELTPFFDLKGYIDAEVERLEREYPTADKTITFNEASESHDGMELDYEDELAIFRNADINRPAWLEKYRIDSLSEGDRLTVEYRALDSALAIQQLIVMEEEGTVARLEINSQTGTVLSDGRQYLRYEPTTGYLIDSYQDRKLGKSLDTRIAVRFPR